MIAGKGAWGWGLRVGAGMLVQRDRVTGEDEGGRGDWQGLCCEQQPCMRPPGLLVSTLSRCWVPAPVLARSRGPRPLYPRRLLQQLPHLPAQGGRLGAGRPGVGVGHHRALGQGQERRARGHQHGGQAHAAAAAGAAGHGAGAPGKRTRALADPRSDSHPHHIKGQLHLQLYHRRACTNAGRDTVLCP